MRGDTLPILVQRAGLQHSSLHDTWDKSVRSPKRQTQVPWAAATASDLSQESGEEKEQRDEVCPFVFPICPYCSLFYKEGKLNRGGLPFESPWQPEGLFSSRKL